MIIGICGFQSSGKDTIADYLIHNHGFIKLSFASALKDIISIMFGWSRDKLEGLTKEDREWREQIDQTWSQMLDMPHLTPRFVMQYFGTDLFRNNFHQDIWTKIVENKLNMLKDKNVVVSDCRFPNEIDMIIRLQGRVIQVHRNPPEWFYKFREGENQTDVIHMHQSEIAWVRCSKDYDIENTGTLEELYKTIDEIIINIKTT